MIVSTAVRRLTWLLATLLALLGTPAAVAGRPLPTLTQQLYLTGTGSGFVRVRLTAPVAVRPDGSIVTSRVVHGGAGFFGAALVREERAAEPAGVATFFVWTPGMAPQHVPFALGPAAAPGAILPVGTYRLYLLTSGAAPVTALLWFKGAPGGPAGRRALTVPNNVSAPSSFFHAPSARGMAAPPVSTHTATHTVPRRAVLLNAAWWVADRVAAYEVARCTSGGAAADTGPAPACPDDAGSLDNRAAVATPGVTSSAAHRYVGAGRWAQKVTSAVAAVPQYAGIALAWLDLGAGFPAAP